MTQRLAGGADAFEGVVGASNYYWRLEETVPSAKAFNDAFRAAYANAIPTDYGAYGYTAVRSLLMAVKAAGDTDTLKVIAALEGLTYDVAKGPERYRACDHQAIQSVLITESRKKSEMQGEADLFRILEVEAGSEAAQDHHGDQEEPGGPGVAQQTRIDRFHVKLALRSSGVRPGVHPGRAQCAASAMCWVPIRLRNTQYVQPW